VEDKRIVFEEFKGLWGWVLEHRRSLLTNDPEADARSSGTPPGHLPIHRFLSVPAMLGDRLVGQVALANASRPYQASDLAFVERLAVLYALALDRKWVEEARLAQFGREMAALEQMAEMPHTQTTARTFGLLSLKESMPGVFEDLTKGYGTLIDRALENRVHKEAGNPSLAIQALAIRLGHLRAGPRDVVDVHMAALRRQEQSANPIKAQVYADEGRLIALELMGYLVSYYRNYAPEAPRAQASFERHSADRRAFSRKGEG
jgi:hypothetical protein